MSANGNDSLCSAQLGSYYLRVVGADVKLAGDVDEPLLGSVEVRVAHAPRAINNVDEVIHGRAAACTRKR